ncbi:EAL domain-containing protein [Psychrobacillus glaciei]|uniref:EAL domain-containing protein n=1 Tax=Psychrobacillus glaciei TaxID=2283160 RepID=A0A5J6SLQ9_9BACI|nr:GGDEF and EAL domain-containing protein [Psychrobacillus glaciei]QFF97674.1 EAL domain-containing protein [Psychrobacillus glaciei]
MMRRQKNINILLVIVFLSVLTFAFINYNSTKQLVLDSVERETNGLLNDFTLEVNRFSMARIAEMQLMAMHISHLLEKDEDITLFLHKQNANMPYFCGLGFITPDGEVNAADGTQFHVKQKESFVRAMNGENMFSSDFSLHQDPSQKVTAISVPVVNSEGKIIGVLSGVINMANIISELADESSLPGIVFLLKENEVIFSSQKEMVFEKVIPHSSQLLNEINKKTNGSWIVDTPTARFVKFQKTESNWVVIVDSISNHDTYKISKAFWNNIFMVLLTLSITFVVFIYVLRLENREKTQSKRDLLTGLGNRVQLEENLAKKLQYTSKKKITLFFINIDHFEDVNERNGYQIGDQLLFKVSRSLLELTGKQNVYRVSNEEFVITSYIDTIQEQRQFALTIVQMLEQPIYFEEGNVLLTASVGVRSYSADDQVELMMRDAAFACKEANKSGGNQFVYFTEQLAKESENNRRIAKKIYQALENDEFYLVYQPIFSISVDQVVSFETLLRWKSPVLGEVGPVDFIPLLEENDSIVKVGSWVIRQVALQVKKWELEGYKDFTVTVNISVKQLQHPTFLRDVETILAETFVEPRMLIFEITESIVAQNIDSAKRILETLNSVGIKIALDDFGTGYSSLSILKMLPFQFMKVDRAFVMEVESDGGESRAILKGILEIASGLELTTIMEGVETKEQLLLLKEMGAHRIQGYYISKPVAPMIAVEFLSKKDKV